jgi:hypothetical protein
MVSGRVQTKAYQRYRDAGTPVVSRTPPHSIRFFAKPGLMLYTPRNDHDVALAADPLFAAEAELHLSLEHPDDLLIGVTVRLDMDTGPDACAMLLIRSVMSRAA